MSMLEAIVTEAVRVAFGEAFSRLIKRVFRDSDGASDELLLRLVVDTLRRYGAKLDQLDSRMNEFERLVECRVPPETRQLVPKIVEESCPEPNNSIPTLHGRETSPSLYTIMISAPGQFRRVYYRSTFLGRNSLRGAADLAELSNLSGTGMLLEQARDGVYLIPRPKFPDYTVNGHALKDTNTALLREGSHDIVIGSLRLQITVSPTHPRS